jgi:hypothetical protein
MNLTEIFEKHSPPKRVLVECSVCESELYDTSKDTPLNWVPSYLSSLIDAHARKHEQETDHAALDVFIDKQTVKREIDCTVTVNG